MRALANTLFKLLAAYAVANFNVTARQTTYRLKRLVVGSAFIMGSILVGTTGIVLGMLGLFFALADISHLVTPSLIAAGVALLIALLVFIQGWQQLRS